MGPRGERDFVEIFSVLSIDPVMQIFLPASNAIINLICSVHEIKCFFEDEITLQGLTQSWEFFLCSPCNCCQLFVG